jgi:hypothetical protein
MELCESDSGNPGAVHGSIRPRLIPTSEIEQEARGLLAHWGDRASEMAVIEEDRAWRYSESFKQGPGIACG